MSVRKKSGKAEYAKTSFLGKGKIGDMDFEKAIEKWNM